jgi:RraA family protein
MTIGFRIYSRRRAVDAKWAAQYRDLPVANVSDMMSRATAGGARLRPLHSGGYMSGPAFTVKTRPGDNLIVHKALDLAQAGDVVVVDAGGDLTNAIVGELMLSYAAKKGLGGVVINGSVRDLAAIRASKFPVYAVGVTHRGPYKDGPGEINVPIAIDGMVIVPGVLVIGDDDGILCVPFDGVEAVYKATKDKHAAEEKQMADIAAGTSDRSWVDGALKRLGCEMMD